MRIVTSMASKKGESGHPWEMRLGPLFYKLAAITDNELPVCLDGSDDLQQVRG